MGATTISPPLLHPPDPSTLASPVAYRPPSSAALLWEAVAGADAYMVRWWTLKEEDLMKKEEHHDVTRATTFDLSRITQPGVWTLDVTALNDVSASAPSGSSTVEVNGTGAKGFFGYSTCCGVSE